jgi:hypothetical protein
VVQSHDFSDVENKKAMMVELNVMSSEFSLGAFVKASLMFWADTFYCPFSDL